MDPGRVVIDMPSVSGGAVVLARFCRELAREATRVAADLDPDPGHHQRKPVVMVTGQRKGTQRTDKNKTTKPEPPRTLMQAHTALVRIRPKSNASSAAWKTYYERSVALYKEIAEIDRGHHHEALYWVDREQKSADEIAARITTEGAQARRRHRKGRR